jgi:hypothetical protein
MAEAEPKCKRHDEKEFVPGLELFIRKEEKAQEQSIEKSNSLNYEPEIGYVCDRDESNHVSDGMC